MYLEYESAEEAISMFGSIADGLLEVLDEHTVYARKPPPHWVARLERTRRLANQLRAEAKALWVDWARATGEIT